MLRFSFLKIKLLFIPCLENEFRPKFLRSDFLFYFLIGLMILKFSVLPFFYCLPQSAFFADLTKVSLIEMTNQEREGLGLSVLKENELLNRAALLKAQDMMEKDYFSHYSPQGTSPWYWFNQADYNYKFAGENLAVGFKDSQEVYKAWLESPLHKENILNSNYIETGIAILKGDFEGNETTIIVQLFGNPQEQKAELNLAEREVSNIKETVKDDQGRAVSGEMDVRVSEPEDVTFKALYFLAFEYYEWFQYIIYGSLLFMIMALLLNVFIRFDVQFKDLILKALGVVLVLVVFIFLDKETIISFISNELRIN